MPTLRITKRTIDALSFSAAGQVLYRDEMLRGFGVRVGSRSKVFFAEGQVNRRTRRVTIGRTDVLSVDAARKRALSILSDMASGADPNAEKRKEAREEVTLGQAFDRFFETRDAMAESSKDSYRRTANLYLKDWRRMAITKIARQAVLKRHQTIAKQNGKVTANNVMRHLRSVYNVTAAAHEEFPPNPVAILTQARAWHPERRRRGIVTAQDLPAWWAAVLQEPDYARDFLLIALFTGTRRNEVAALRWDQIDLTGRSLHIPKTKNGDPLDLPLSDYLVELLRDRLALVGASPGCSLARAARGT